MTTIDLGTPPPPPAHLLDALPRRVGLTLPELRLVAAAAGDAPLPFDRAQRTDAPDVLREPASPTAPSMADRLGATPANTDDDVLRGVLDALPDPAASLGRRGLLVDGEVDAGLRGAVGLLATPSVAVDLDVVVGGARAVAWHRQDGGAVAALSTVDGVVFELAWFPVSAWAGELGRVAVLPEDADTAGTAVPASVDLPLEVADAAGEALATGRGDLVPEVLRQSGGAVTADGVVLDEARALDLVRAVHAETRGRLRVLVADVSGGTEGDEPDEADLGVGVRSWVLLADGWRSLRTHDDAAADGPPRVTLTAVDPAGLAAEIAPLLAQVGHDTALER